MNFCAAGEALATRSFLTQEHAEADKERLKRLKKKKVMKHSPSQGKSK